MRLLILGCALLGLAPLSAQAPRDVKAIPSARLTVTLVPDSDGVLSVSNLRHASIERVVIKRGTSTMTSAEHRIAPGGTAEYRMRDHFTRGLPDATLAAVRFDDGHVEGTRDAVRTLATDLSGERPETVKRLEKLRQLLSSPETAVKPVVLGGSVRVAARTEGVLRVVPVLENLSSSYLVAWSFEEVWSGDTRNGLTQDTCASGPDEPGRGAIAPGERRQLSSLSNASSENLKDLKLELRAAMFRDGRAEGDFTHVESIRAKRIERNATCATRYH